MDGAYGWWQKTMINWSERSEYVFSATAVLFNLQMDLWFPHDYVVHHRNPQYLPSILFKEWKIFSMRWCDIRGTPTSVSVSEWTKQLIRNCRVFEKSFTANLNVLFALETTECLLNITKVCTFEDSEASDLISYCGDKKRRSSWLHSVEK